MSDSYMPKDCLFIEKKNKKLNMSNEQRESPRITRSGGKPAGNYLDKKSEKNSNVTPQKTTHWDRIMSDHDRRSPTGASAQPDMTLLL